MRRKPKALVVPLLGLAMVGLTASGVVAERAAGLALQDPTTESGAVVPVTTRSEEARAAFDQGRDLQSNVRVDEARERFDEAIALDPVFALAHGYRAVVSTIEEREAFLVEAEKHLDGISEGERMLIASFRAAHDGKPDEQFRIIQELAASYPGDKYVLGTLASLHYGRGDHAAAAETLERVLALDPTTGPAYNMLGYAYMEQGEMDKAEKAFMRYAEAAPDEPNPHDSMGELYLKTGRYADALARFEKAVELNPRFFYSRQNIGNAHLLAGDYERARKAYKAAMEHGEVPADRVDMQLRVAEAWLHEGDVTSAKDAMQRALDMARESQLHGSELQVLNRMVTIHAELEEVDEAERLGEEIATFATRMDIPVAGAQWARLASLHTRALVHALRGEHEDAKRVAGTFELEAAARGGEIARFGVPRLHGLLAMERGEWAEAAAHLEKDDPTNTASLFRLGLAHEALGDADRARAYFEKAAQMNMLYSYPVEYALTRNKAQQKLAAGSGG